MSEKQTLLLNPVTTPVACAPARKLLKTFIILATASAFAWLLLSQPNGPVGPSYAPFDKNGDYEHLCPQSDALVPSAHADIWNQLVNNKFTTDEFKKKAVDLLSGAVQIKTESYDSMGPVGEDPRWEAFGPFHDYLVASFPQVHTTLTITKVNTWGLVYVWTGTDESLKPGLFAAHQDVVPVNPETFDQWAFPPYSGHFDGERIWGRGSADDKSGLIGILTSLENLIQIGFKPTRSVVLAFGFDEEASGLQGADSLAKYLLPTYGENSFSFIIDEGGGFSERYGTVFATPGVAEKGYVDVHVAVSTPGGHSSVPPPHTSIGILAALLVEYEANPYTAKLSRDTVTYDLLKCFAAHSPNMPKDLRKAIIRSTHSDKALRNAEVILFQDPLFKALAGTTQAIDLIGGGVKANALPESAWAAVNHRITIESSVAEVIAHDTALLKPLAQKFNLSLTSFGEHITDSSLPSFGSLVLSDAWGTHLEPAPVTPYGKEAGPYQVLSGTIKSVYNAHRKLDSGDNVKVQPAYMTGNTDTRYYWKLTDHIFRYNHHNQEGPKALGNIHTVNESMGADAFFEQVEFFTTFILNVDEAKGW